MSFALVLIFKNFLFHFSEMCAYLPRIPLSQGRFGQSSRTLGAGCDGREGNARRARPVRTAKSCGPDLPTLGSSLPVMIGKRRWLKSPVHRGEREISRKTIAQGMSDRFDVPVVTNACAFYQCTRGCGCVAHPAFPAPSLFRKAFRPSKPRVHLRREINFVRHCEERSDDVSAEAQRAQAEAIQPVPRGDSLDCFASLAMTAERLFDIRIAVQPRGALRSAFSF